MKALLSCETNVMIWASGCRVIRATAEEKNFSCMNQGRGLRYWYMGYLYREKNKYNIEETPPLLPHDVFAMKFFLFRIDERAGQAAEEW